jgi:hypothetical protein
MTARRIEPLAQEHVVVYESPDPKRIFPYSPGLAKIPAGEGAPAGGRLVATTGDRIVATIDIGGPGVRENVPGPKLAKGESGYAWAGKVFTSDDHGKSWTERTSFPFMHARPFVSGGSVYVLGQAGDLTVIRSDDAGETWSEPARLTEGQRWHQAPCNVHCANGNVYLVMERTVYDDCRCWGPSVLAPVLMRGRVGDDLTRRENWTFASELVFRDAVPHEKLDYFGVPFYEVLPGKALELAPGRACAPPGWLETNVVQFTDPDHIWHDPEGKTFHLWMRAHTGHTGLAAIAKVVEQDDGSMQTMLQTAPSGKKMVYVPCPGGQMKFHILYDEGTRLFWLLSTQAADSMTRADRLPADRYNLPNNERRRLALHFSRNCIDWCFAGLVAVGPADNASRHYASMLIDGDNLHVMSRSGDERAKSAHDGDLITFHTIPNFRELAY